MASTKGVASPMVVARQSEQISACNSSKRRTAEKKETEKASVGFNVSGPWKPWRGVVMLDGQIDDRDANCAYNEIHCAYMASKRHTLGIDDVIDNKLDF